MSNKTLEKYAFLLPIFSSMFAFCIVLIHVFSSNYESDLYHFGLVVLICLVLLVLLVIPRSVSELKINKGDEQ
jgi:hypothetical protein